MNHDLKASELIPSLLVEAARIILLLFLTLTTLVFVAYEVQAVLHPYQLDYGEAPLVDQALRLSAGWEVYRPDLSSPPYTVSNYPPLYVGLLAPWVNAFGPNFWAGRLLSVVSAVGVALLLASMVKRRFERPSVAWATGLLFLAIPYVVHWSSLLRIDLVALFLSIAALYVLTHPPLTSWRVVGVGLLLVAAIYTRQSYALAAPFASFAWLIVRDWRSALHLTLIVAGLTLLLFLVLNAVTDGGFFFNVVTANVNEFSLGRLSWELGQFWDFAFILVTLGAVALILSVVVTVRRREDAGLAPLVGAYLVGATLSTLTVGKIGSNVNYFLELCAALTLAMGFLLGRTQKRSWLHAGLLALLVWQSLSLMQTTLWRYAGPLRERKEAVPILRDLERMVAEAEGPVIGDEYMGMVTLQGRTLYIQPFEMTQLAHAGLWDQSDFVENIAEGRFPLVLIHHFPNYDVYKERWTPEMLEAIDEHYVLRDRIADTWIYHPRGSGEEVDACPGAPWPLPSSARLGLRRVDGFVDFMGRGDPGTIPVRAVADGLLVRRPEWVGAVAVRHEDPLRTGEYAWTYYGDMLSADGLASYVAETFPPGVDLVPVEGGELLGYQGTWSGIAGRPAWVHVRFGVIAPAEDDAFPLAILPEVHFDPAPYLGLELPLDAEETVRPRCTP